MKISRITVEFLVDEGTAVDEFLSRLTSTPSRVIEHTPVPFGSAATPSASENTASPTGALPTTGTDTGSRRRRIAAPAPANPTAGSEPTEKSAPTQDASATDASTQSRRRRSSPPAAAPDPMPINDAEMSKAASNTADVLVNLGDDGPGMVMLILEDFGVKSAGDVPQDQRQKFLDECAKEIRLSKEAKEMAP